MAELIELEQIADVRNIIGYVERSRDRLLSRKDEVVGTKLSYVERAISVLNDLNTALQNVSIDNTSMAVLQEIRTRVVELDGAVSPSGQDLDANRILELCDKLLSQMPLIQFLTSNSLISKANKFSGEIDATATEVKALSDNAKDEINKFQEEVRKVAEKKLAKISSSIDKIDKLSHFVAGKALSSEFAKHAEDENDLVRQWTNATSVLGAITILLLGLFFLAQFGFLGESRFQNVTQETYIAQITTKVLLTLILGLTTRWASKRANFHLSQVAKYRRIALCMDSLDSFVATLEPASKDRTIAYVTAVLLTEDSHSDPQSEFDSLSVSELLKQITEKAKSNTIGG